MKKIFSLLAYTLTAVVLVLSGCSADKSPDPINASIGAARSAVLGGDLLVDNAVTTLDGEQVYDNISVINGGTLQVTDYDGTGTTGTLLLRARVSVTLDATSTIVADTAGFRGGNGSPGQTAGEGPGGGGPATTDGGGGAGHAGTGDAGTLDNLCLATDGAAGVAYGSSDIDDVTMGSGGGGGNGGGAVGGDGGGAIVISAPTVTLAGTVTANGGDGIVGGGDASGGGSGGSIAIIADSLDCTGALAAHGGNGGNVDDDGGGAGGGWVKVSATSTTNACAVDTSAGVTGDCPLRSGTAGQNPTNTDGLSSVYCGNGTVEAWEGCDDSGTGNGDGCNDSCMIETDSVLYLCEFASQCASGVCSGAPSSAGPCIACLDDETGTTQDTGCSGGTPYCDATATPVCVAAACTNDQTGETRDTLCVAPGPAFCDESNNVSNPSCVLGCSDDQTGGTPDTACTVDPDRYCDNTGSNPLCVPAACSDDQLGATPDTDCAVDPNRYCDESADHSNPLCMPGCADDSAGGTDTGCTGTGSGADGACDVSGSNPLCVDCTVTADCSSGDGCNLGTNTCVAGCFGNTDCSSPEPICDLTSGSPGACVECVTTPDCGGSGLVCMSLACEVDTDNDGIPDSIECPGASNCPDSDGDGDTDEQDTDSDDDGELDGDECTDPGAGCTDTDNDGLPDYVESSILDSDNDGIVDELDPTDDPPPPPLDGGIDGGTDGGTDAGTDAGPDSGSSGSRDAGPGIAGGGGCSVADGASNTPSLMFFMSIMGLAGVWLSRRRRIQRT
ncbi:MAG: hypothetical protein H6714_09950 [Myxococcales bacterium]|nr:hypothetical protein [Myxococcales bacterium]